VRVVFFLNIIYVSGFKGLILLETAFHISNLQWIHFVYVTNERQGHTCVQVSSDCLRISCSAWECYLAPTNNCVLPVVFMSRNGQQTVTSAGAWNWLGYDSLATFIKWARLTTSFGISYMWYLIAVLGQQIPASARKEAFQNHKSVLLSVSEVHEGQPTRGTGNDNSVCDMESTDFKMLSNQLAVFHEIRYDCYVFRNHF
jgi:hypothetical protein